MKKYDVLSIVVMIALSVFCFYLMKEIKIINRVNMELNSDVEKEKATAHVYTEEFNKCRMILFQNGMLDWNLDYGKK